MTGGNAFLCGLNNLRFAEQHIAQGYFSRPVVVANVRALARQFLEFGNRKTFAARVLQSMLPDLAFQYDRVAVEQMLLRPLHGFTHANALFVLHGSLRDFLKPGQRFAFSLGQLSIP